MNKTVAQLKQEWGAERFVQAYRQLSEWNLEHFGEQPSMEELMNLMNNFPDAFELHVSRLLEESNKIKEENNE
jgi:hypothetical protein